MFILIISSTVVKFRILSEDYSKVVIISISHNWIWKFPLKCLVNLWYSKLNTLMVKGIAAPPSKLLMKCSNLNQIQNFLSYFWIISAGNLSSWILCNINFQLPTSIFTVLAPVIQRMDNAIHRLNHYPVDSAVCFVNTCPLDSDLSAG